jgi:hypothetical protein
MPREKRSKVLPLAALLAACASSPGRSSLEAAPASRAHCPDPGHAAEARSKYEQARAVLVQCSDELCRKSVQGNADVGRAMGLLEEAAAAGNLDAQALYGRELLQFAWITYVAEPHAEGRYVDALTNLRLAARRGSAAAADVVPGLASLSVAADGSVQGRIHPSLSDVPVRWLVRVVQDADRLLTCY